MTLKKNLIRSRLSKLPTGLRPPLILFNPANKPRPDHGSPSAVAAVARRLPRASDTFPRRLRSEMGSTRAVWPVTRNGSGVYRFGADSGKSHRSECHPSFVLVPEISENYKFRMGESLSAEPSCQIALDEQHQQEISLLCLGPGVSELGALAPLSTGMASSATPAFTPHTTSFTSSEPGLFLPWDLCTSFFHALICSLFCNLLLIENLIG